MQRGKKFAGITESLNRILNKSLESFSQNTEWTDINNWLLTLQSVLKDYPSPYITEKVLLSKRLNQCMNPILPDKIHECVLRIHQIIFTNMKAAAEGNVNEYIRMFADDLGVYSVSILPYFTHSSVKEHRLIVLRLIKTYYLDLGKELIPVVPGFMKSLLPVYSQAVDQQLIEQIQKVLDLIVKKVGRKYVIGILWSTVLKFTDCKQAGMKYLGLAIKKMDVLKGEQEFQESHGFSQEEEEIRRQEMQELQRAEKMKAQNVGKDDNLVAVSSASKKPPQAQAEASTPNNQKFTDELRTPTPLQNILGKGQPQQTNKPREFEVQQTEELMSEERLNQMDNQNMNGQHVNNLNSLNSLNSLNGHHLRGIQEVSEQEGQSQALSFTQGTPTRTNGNHQDLMQHLFQSSSASPSPSPSRSAIKRKETTRLFDSGHGQIEQFTANPNTQKEFGASSVNFADDSSNYGGNAASIRLNKVPLVTTPGIESIKQGIDSDREQNNYPSSNTLVVSALLSCLQQDSQIIKRAALDFMFSHLRVKSDILDENDRKLLVEGLVSLYKRKQISICKRVNRWLFGKQDEENRYNITQKNEFIIQYIINAFTKVLQKQPTSLQDCAVPIKILQNFYIQHPHLVEKTLGYVALSVLRYIFNFGTKSKKSSASGNSGNLSITAPSQSNSLAFNSAGDPDQITDEVLKAGKRFLENLPSYYPAIFKSLGNEYLKAIHESNELVCFETVKYIDFCYLHLMKHEHGVEELQYITLTLEALCEGLYQLAQKGSYKNHLFLKDNVLLVYNLVARRSSVQKFNKKERQRVNEKYFEETGQHQLPPERIKYQAQLQNQQKSQEQRYEKISKNLQHFFVGMGQYLKSIPNVTTFEEPYKMCSLAIVKIQSHLPVNKAIPKQLPEWFATIQQGIRISNPTIALASIQAIIKILMWQSTHPIYKAVMQIIIQEKSRKEGGNDYQKLALQKLWALLDFPHMHGKVIDLIVGFSKFFPYEFTETVKRSFTKINAAEKQASIQRFSHFWRLTGFKYKQLLSTNREFGELNKVGLFMMLDFLDDPNPLVRHAAKNWLMQSIPLFSRIIQPLLHELLRNCSDWYQTPKGVLLIKNQYDTMHVFSTIRRIKSILSTGSYAVLRFIYQSEISQSLDELRQKISDIKGPFLTQNNVEKDSPDLTQSLLDRQPVLPRALERQLQLQMNNKSITSVNKSGAPTRMAYFDLLMILVLKYAEGHTIESMGIKFYIGNSGVNASAVEFLETLIDYIDSPKLCQKILNFILGSLFKVLKQVVMNREYIMQIQILGLLKKVFFSSSFRKKADAQEIRKFFKGVFTDKKFLASTLEGLNTPFSYVRGQFINFLTICIPLIADFLDPQECTECIKHIIFTYYKIIKDLRINLLTDVLQEEQQRDDQELIKDQKKQALQLQGKSSQPVITTAATTAAVIDNKTSNPSSNTKLLLFSRIKQLQHEIKKQQKYVKLTDNLSQIAMTNQTLSVLHGLSAILNYFFDLNKLDISELDFEFTNPYTFFDTFKSIITLGLASSQKDGKLIQRKQFLHNTQTCQQILKDLQPVYETVLRSWPLSEQYVRISTQEFSSIGMRLFNFEKFSTYNKIVKDLIQYVQDEKQSIWGKIFSIMQPLFYRFPKQITDIYLKLWVRECDDANVSRAVRDSADGQYKHPESSSKKQLLRASSEKTQLLMKCIETIIVNDFPMNVVFHAILQSSVLAELALYYTETEKNKKTGNVLKFQINKKQSKVLFFLYVYLCYVHLDEADMTKERLLEMWSLIMKVLKPFQRSKSPLVAIWILEIINLSARKYSPKQLLQNQKFKHDLHRLINDKLKYLALVASRKEHFFFRDPMSGKINFQKAAQEQQQDEIQQYHLVLPFPPNIYEIYKKKPHERNHTDNEMLKTAKPGDNQELQMKYRIYCFKILKKLGLEILQNTYLPEKMHWVIVRATEWLQIILPVIEQKSPHNMTYAECASEILYDILDKARILFIKTLKPKVLAIFNKDDFFICNPNTLNYWSKIMDWIVSMDKYNETFTEYLEKVSLSSSYFGSESAQNKKRIKSFERICFILYSGQKDKYSQKIKTLLQKMADVIKMSQSAHPALLILILFAIRILILRLSQISLNQLFIDIWPMILALLMQIFSKQYVKVNLDNEVSRNPNLLLASLKLIQMISLTNLGEFAHHQWIFIYDYFGLKLTMSQITQQMKMFVNSRPDLANIIEIKKGIKPSPFTFKPALLNHMPMATSINYSSQTKGKVKNQPMKYQPQTRKIIIKNSSITDESQLKVQVLFLMQYLNHISQYRTNVDWTQIENVIVDDFIKLDSFIHEIKND